MKKMLMVITVVTLMSLPAATMAQGENLDFIDSASQIHTSFSPVYCQNTLLSWSPFLTDRLNRIHQIFKSIVGRNYDSYFIHIRFNNIMALNINVS